MKLSDYVAAFLAELGIRHVFVVSGGASVHLIQSLADCPGVQHICTHHEQASAMAADAYARITGNLGAAVSTSGPGATNLLTGVCCAFYDSIPVIYITGQVATFRLKGNRGVRQIGFQETDVIDIFGSATKYTTQITDPNDICFELEKACHMARSGRPGPVVVDIPDDLQRAEISPEALRHFHPDPPPKGEATPSWLAPCLDLIKHAKRPVLIVGAGVRLAHAEPELVSFLEATGMPFAPTWAMADFGPSTHPLRIGTFGTHGTRYANFAVQNADLVLCVGTRLDSKATGSPPRSFARGARKVMVDIDPAELAKFQENGIHPDLSICEDAKAFLGSLVAAADRNPKPGLGEWSAQISEWKGRYPICPDSYYEEGAINPYVFVKKLAGACAEKEVLVSDTGCALAWMMQAFDFKAGQRFLHDWNNTAMGWALPAAIAASLALDHRRVVCVVGDGSFQMNIQELATVAHHHLPIKVFLLCNGGYSMIRQTQDQWLGSRYIGSSSEGGLGFPDFAMAAQAYGIPATSVSLNGALDGAISTLLEQPGPALCQVDISPSHRVVPQVQFGRPNEDPDPLLDREEFRRAMLIPLWNPSGN